MKKKEDRRRFWREEGFLSGRDLSENHGKRGDHQDAGEGEAGKGKKGGKSIARSWVLGQG